jgi:demethylmenaquinone methyltransferase/2-methoxy-6-polyprenyl-1,4-benzoquinol methylase
MTETSPIPGRPETRAVREMFDRIAPRYDLLNRVLSGRTDVRWRRRAVDALALPSGGTVLDVCCGTADLLIEALGRDPQGTGLGVDLSGGMLVRGRSKLEGRGLSRRFVLTAGDATSLPAPSRSFEGAMVGFGIRNVGDQLGALREMHRVLRQGGRVVVLEFSMPAGPFGRLYRFYFESVLPRIGAVMSGDGSAYRYLPASVGEFPTPEVFGRMMEQAGFAEVAFTSLTGGIAHLYRGRRP